VYRSLGTKHLLAKHHQQFDEKDVGNFHLLVNLLLAPRGGVVAVAIVFFAALAHGAECEEWLSLLMTLPVHSRRWSMPTVAAKPL
jgi:hypothetical protein